MIFLILLGGPLLAALAALALPPNRRWAGGVNTLLTATSFGAAVTLWQRVLTGDVPVLGPAEFLRADALATLLAVCVSFVVSLAAWLGPRVDAAGHYTPDQVRRFRAIAGLFAFTMLLAVTANNVGVMWVAIEATTIASALLIPLKLSKASVEASWKYILIGSVGIALAFGGTVLAYFDFLNAAGHQDSALNWTVLSASAASLHADVMRLAFVFLLIGYGTKAGLAPMHTWLPDAHSEAPTPLSAMMSGVLLAVAVYAIVRWKAVVDATAGSTFTDTLLLLLGVLSVVIAAFSLIAQPNIKRMLAYSSIEHTGLTCIGLALGPLGAFAALLHLVNHSIAKSMMFLAAERIQHRYHTTDISRVTGLLAAMPVTGTLFAAGTLGLLGLPPFGLFVSHLKLLQAGFASARPFTMMAVLALSTVVFVALLTNVNRMLYGDRPDNVAAGEADWTDLAPLGACIILLVVLGLVIPEPLNQLLMRSAEVAVR